MDIAFYGLAVATIILAVSCIIKRFFRNKQKNIVFNVEGFWLIVAFGIFSSIMLCFFCHRNEELETLIIFAMMSSICLIACIAWLNETIIFDDTQCTVRNFTGIKKTYKYSEIVDFRLKRTKYRHGTKTTSHFRVRKNKFSVSTTARNYDEFIEKVFSVYKK